MKERSKERGGSEGRSEGRSKKGGHSTNAYKLKKKHYAKIWVRDFCQRFTKPLHHTQTLLKEDETGKIFSIRVILNFELERELLGFGSKMRVLSPRILVKQIKTQLQKTVAHYDAPGEGINPLLF